MGKNGMFSVKAYAGDMKTLLAFNFTSKSGSKNLAGFTIQCAPEGQAPYYLQNNLQYEIPADHAQDPKEPANSSINAPLHKFRWLHVPGSVHQGASPVVGKYTYTVTPRYLRDNSLLPIDTSLSADVVIEVGPFQKKGLELGFTRGFTQSQAFQHHFGPKALIQPKTKVLQFDTSQVSGTDPKGNEYTFEQEYEWLGFTAREKIFALLADVIADRSLTLDMFAYDLNEPDIISELLKLAGQGRIRIILDNSALHHGNPPKPEDQFERLFKKAAKGKAEILRGKFGRYAHDKILIVSEKGGLASKVLTGSTNFSVTGLYVNSNHVVIFDDATVAGAYADIFEEVWSGEAAKGAFTKLPDAAKTFSFSSAKTPRTEITFAPHKPDFAATVLDDLANRIQQEGTKPKTVGSVLFAVMQIDKGTGPVYPALIKLHSNQDIFSYGISDSPGGIYLYPVGKKNGVLVTGKPVNTQLPPPFDQVRNIGGVGHQVHHKFVVCGFNGTNPVVYCGSSNLAEGGEENNGDNLLAIHDEDVATAFAIEALALVDHFNFLDRVAKGPKAKKKGKRAPASKQQAAISAGWFLSTDDKWTQPYFDPNDLHSVDRQLFG